MLPALRGEGVGVMSGPEECGAGSPGPTVSAPVHGKECEGLSPACVAL